MTPMRLPPEWIRIRGCLREAVSDIDHCENLLARNELYEAVRWLDEVQESMRRANGLMAARTRCRPRLVTPGRTRRVPPPR